MGKPQKPRGADDARLSTLASTPDSAQSSRDGHLSTMAAAPASADDHALGSTMAESPPSGAASRQPRSGAQVVGAHTGRVDLPTVAPGHFAIKREIARGGLGAVLEARDKVLDRTVAIKRGLYDSDAANARFIREALVTARLQHPSIVPVYEAGRWPGGEPFYAMKLVSGRPLSTVIAAAKTLEERLALLPSVIAVADAMAYAHGQRILHRDLKPDNVLVGDFGETVVIDWGLAKDLDADDASLDVDTLSISPYAVAAQGLTVAGAVMGTPEYMAPEQAKGLELDERTDVYAIGAMLYHALAGEPPFRAKTKEEVLALVRDGTPKPLDPRTPADLATIVKKAMARDPAARYPSAKQLADDLRRFQTGQLVSARGYTRWELLARWAKRHKTPIAIAAFAVVVLAVVGVLAVANVVKERNVATRERNKSAQQEQIAQQARTTAEQRNSELILVQAQSRVERDPTSALAWLKQYPTTAPNWKAAHQVIIDALERGPARHVWLHEKARKVAFTHDGNIVVSAGNDGDVRYWDASSGRALGTLLVPAGVRTLTMSPMANTLAIGTMEGGVLLVDIPNGTPTKVLQHDGDVRVLAFSPDGNALATAGSNGQVHVYDRARSTSQTLTGHEGIVNDVVFSATGVLVATAGDDRTVRLWDRAKGTSTILRGHDDFVTAVTFASEDRVVSASEDKTARIWSTARARAEIVLRHDQIVVDVAVTTDGRVISRDPHVIVVWTADGKRQHEFSNSAQFYDWGISRDQESIGACGPAGAFMIDLATGDERPLRMEGGASAIAISPDGHRIATLGTNFLVTLWEPSSRLSRNLLGHPAFVVGIGLTPDNRFAITASDDRTIRRWDLATAAPSKLLATFANSIFQMSMSANGEYVASTAYSPALYLSRIATGETRELKHPEETIAFRFSADSTRLITATRNSLHAWDVASLDMQTLVNDQITAFDVTTDAKRIVYGRADGKVIAFDVASKRQKQLGSHDGPVGAVHVLPDATHAVSRAAPTASGDRTIRLWNLDTGAHRTLFAGTNLLFASAISPDGRWIAVGGLGRNIYLIEVVTGRVRELFGLGPLVTTNLVQFSPDSTLIASGSLDGTVRLWTVATGASQIAHRHGGKVQTVTFSRDGTLLASGSHDRTGWIGAVDPSACLEPHSATLQHTLTDSTTTTIDAENRALTPQ